MQGETFAYYGPKLAGRLWQVVDLRRKSVVRIDFYGANDGLRRCDGRGAPHARLDGPGRRRSDPARLRPRTGARWPVGTDSFFQPRRAAFWLLAVLIVNGLFYTVQRVLDGLPRGARHRLPGAGRCGGSTRWLSSWPFARSTCSSSIRRKLSSWPSPGAASARCTSPAPANVAIQNLCAKLVSPEFAAVWGPAIAGPITEEFLKLAGVVLLVLVARTQFQTYLSVLIVGAMTGLGFQVVENLSDTVNASMNFPRENQVAPVLLNLLTRGLLSGLWSACGLHDDRVLRRRVVPAAPAAADGGAARGASSVLRALRGPCISCGTRRCWKTASATATATWRRCWSSRAFPAMAAAGLLWRVAARENGAYLHGLAACFLPERDLIARRRVGCAWARPCSATRSAGRWARTFGRRARRLKTQLQREQLRLIRKAGDLRPRAADGGP